MADPQHARSQQAFTGNPYCHGRAIEPITIRLGPAD
jgi:hypothetical protein